MFCPQKLTILQGEQNPFETAESDVEETYKSGA